MQKRFKLIVTASLLALAAGAGALAFNAFSHEGRGFGSMQGMRHGHMGMGHGIMNEGPHSATPAEIGGIHELLDSHDRITRKVVNLPDGIRTITESDDPRIARILKEHVASMGKRVSAGKDPGLPIESPALRAIFRNKDKISTTYETTDKGIIVLQTSTDPETVAILQKHASEVSDLVRGGIRALHSAMMGNEGMMHGGGTRGGMKTRGMQHGQED
jgi:hypothetical protein